MINLHSDETINAVVFASEQAREALLFLAQSSAIERAERMQLLKSIELLGKLQKRAEETM